MRGLRILEAAGGLAIAEYGHRARSAGSIRAAGSVLPAATHVASAAALSRR